MIGPRRDRAPPGLDNEKEEVMAENRTVVVLARYVMDGHGLELKKNFEAIPLDAGSYPAQRDGLEA